MFHQALVTGPDPSTLLHLRTVLGQLEYKVESIPLEQGPIHPFSVAIVDCRQRNSRKFDCPDHPLRHREVSTAGARRLRTLSSRGLVIALCTERSVPLCKRLGADVVLHNAEPHPGVLSALIREGIMSLARPTGGPLGLILGRAPKLVSVLSAIRSYADSHGTVLISGETGTGKELAARGIHLNSPRAEKPFVAINCAAIPEALLESEIFGHARGAFTGAVTPHVGRIAAAAHGTLFLDEISELTLPMQAKLLRVLQEHEYRPVGGNRTLKADVRIVAATNRDLQQDVKMGRFRADLYWRLEVITVEMPPLRERRSDVLPITYHVIDRTNHTHKRHVTGLDLQARRQLLAHQWPGNVRELENTIERAVILRSEGALQPEDIILRRRTRDDFLGNVRLPPDGLDLAEMTASLELLLINQALEKTNGNRTEAARLLRINRTTLLEKLRRQGAAE